MIASASNIPDDNMLDQNRLDSHYNLTDNEIATQNESPMNHILGA